MVGYDTGVPVQKSQNEQQVLENLLAQYKIAVDKSSIFSKSDTHGKITYVNDEFCRLSQYPAEELLGKTHSIIRHPDMPISFFKKMWQELKEKKIWKGVIKNRAKDGSSYYVSATIIPILNENSEIKEYLGIRHDITEVYIKDRIIEQTMIDDITELKSRTAFMQDIKDGKEKSIVLLDIASFNHFNDFYGHETGDILLNEIAKELQAYTTENRYECSLYRLPIDIFALIFTDIYSTEEIETYILTFLDKFRTWPKAVGNTQIYTQAVAGMAKGSNEQVYQYADIALQYAKKNKKSFQLFNNELNMQKQIEKNFYISKLLNTAIFNDDIPVHYQPIINNRTQKCEKLEALVRIKDENSDILSPGLFLNIAKQIGVYTSMTRSIIKTTLNTLDSLPECEISFNLSYEDIVEPTMVTFLEDIFSKKEIAQRIVLEITETEEMKDLNMVKAFLIRMKKLGCKIAIDDFGTGYSNFKYLMDLQADYLKIDGSLISALPTDNSSLEIVKAITSFTKKMGIKTIAEFVSTEEIFKIVQSLDIDYSQGFYFSLPLDIQDTKNFR